MMIQTEKAGLLGPFETVEVLDDRCVAGGMDWFFTVTGTCQVIETDAPGLANRYTWNGEQYVLLALPTAEITAAQLARWEDIKIERDRRLITGGYPVGDHWFHSDVIARSQHQANARKADRVEYAGGDMSLQLTNADNVPIYVKSKDNGFMPITGTLAQAIMDAAEVHEMATYTAALVHKAAMEASADPANYDYLSAGWPEGYFTP